MHYKNELMSIWYYRGCGW